MSLAPEGKKKLALVTGASRGIGAEIAKTLARDGFHVALNFSSNEARAREVLDAILTAGGTGELCGFDVSQPASVDTAIDALTAHYGAPVHTLVNNAGVAIDGLLMRFKDADIDRSLDINLKGAIYCSRAVTKGMMKARDGVILMISSVIGEMGNSGQAVYASTKAGLIGLSKSVAKELASRNIRCNTITPGYIATEMTGALTESQKEAILRQVPLGSLGTPQDVAEMVAFLASSKARYVTGQVLGVNGGLRI
jgi:3-oxoacyl-[acyl-carrier protein] reductase